MEVTRAPLRVVVSGLRETTPWPFETARRLCCAHLQRARGRLPSRSDCPPAGISQVGIGGNHHPAGLRGRFHPAADASDISPGSFPIAVGRGARPHDALRFVGVEAGGQGDGKFQRGGLGGCLRKALQRGWRERLLHDGDTAVRLQRRAAQRKLLGSGGSRGGGGSFGRFFSRAEKRLIGSAQARKRNGNFLTAGVQDHARPVPAHELRFQGFPIGVGPNSGKGWGNGGTEPDQ